MSDSLQLQGSEPFYFLWYPVGHRILMGLPVIHFFIHNFGRVVTTERIILPRVIWRFVLHSFTSLPLCVSVPQFKKYCPILQGNKPRHQKSSNLQGAHNHCMAELGTEFPLAPVLLINTFWIMWCTSGQQQISESNTSYVGQSLGLDMSPGLTVLPGRMRFQNIQSIFC